ncbi:LuxR C-terminal-related transcriptional regulator [Collimonas sp.]|jgi:DNA-binding CsgD family transcriptional regulator|uniref:helix-turn-helix transcriptional regulator n=1 Tax=Collimonas sp. TaxID=1963772 RepID=UPI0037C0BC8D
MQRLLAKLDSCDFSLKMDITSANGAPVVHTFGSLPTAMLQLLNGPAPDPGDPIQQHLTRSRLPLNWQAEQVCKLCDAALYPLLKSMGITQGMSVAIHSKNAVSRLDFYGKSVIPSVLSTNAQADALLLGVHLQETAELLWRKVSQSQEPLLSTRELECLRWSADGKTSNEIGLILGISQRTVYFHLKNVATKLGVLTTRHAISRAVMIGIIKPDN